MLIVPMYTMPAAAASIRLKEIGSAISISMLKTATTITNRSMRRSNEFPLRNVDRRSGPARDGDDQQDQQAAGGQRRVRQHHRYLQRGRILRAVQQGELGAEIHEYPAHGHEEHIADDQEHGL